VRSWAVGASSAKPHDWRHIVGLAEHLFGPMKARMAATHFLAQRFQKYPPKWRYPSWPNLTRVMNIAGIKPLIAG
jgi:hypothetical protein